MRLTHFRIQLAVWSAIAGLFLFFLVLLLDVSYLTLEPWIGLAASGAITVGVLMTAYYFYVMKRCFETIAGWSGASIYLMALIILGFAEPPLYIVGQIDSSFAFYLSLLGYDLATLITAPFAFLLGYAIVSSRQQLWGIGPAYGNVFLLVAAWMVLTAVMDLAFVALGAIGVLDSLPPLQLMGEWTYWTLLAGGVILALVTTVMEVMILRRAARALGEQSEATSS